MTKCQQTRCFQTPQLAMHGCEEDRRVKKGRELFGVVTNENNIPASLDLKHKDNRAPDANNTQSPLLIAIKSRHCDFHEIFLRHKDDVNISDDKGQPILFHALYFLKGPTIRHFVHEVHDPNSLLSTCGKPALNYAIRHNMEAVLPLIRSGCDVMKPDIVHGDTPMHVACFYGNMEVISVLIQSGASVNCLNKAGQTPMDKLLALCSQPAKNSATRSRFCTSHILTRIGFKVNSKAEGQNPGTRERILRLYGKAKSCYECMSLQHLCRLRLREILPPLTLKHAVSSLDIAFHLKDFLLYRPLVLDHDVMCSHSYTWIIP